MIVGGMCKKNAHLINIKYTNFVVKEIGIVKKTVL